MPFPRFRLTLLLILGCTLMTEICGQTDPVFARQINSATGLSAEDFNYFLYRDSYGYLWISAMNGLNRYDGHTIRQYYAGERSPHKLWDNNLQSDLIEDAQGNLWFTTVYGLNVYRRDIDLIEKVIPVGEDSSLLEGTFIFGYCSEQQTILLNGPSPGSKCRFTYEVDLVTLAVEKVAIDSSLVGNKVDFLEEGEAGWKFLTTSEEHLRIISREDVTTELLRSIPLPFLSSGKLYALKVRPGNQVYLAHSEGVFHADLQAGVIQQLVNSETDSITQIVDIEFGDDSLMYLASRTDGLFVQNLRTREIEQVFVRENENLYAFERGVSRLYGDSDGNFWISTDGDGIYQINPRKDLFRTFPVIPGFSQLQESISKIGWSEGEEVIWVTTMNDIYAVTTSGQFLPALTKTTSTKLRSAIQGSRIYCVLPGTHGELMVGTDLGLFVQLDRSSPFVKIQSDGSETAATCIHQLTGGEIIVGFAGKPPVSFELETRTLEPFQVDFELETPMHILEPRRGGLIIANTEKRLYYFPEFEGGNPGEGIELEIPGQIAGIVAMQNSNVLMVGTEEGIKTLRITDSTLELSQDLLFEVRGLQSLQVEHDSILWLGTNQGVIRYEDGEVDHFTTIDGLASNGASLFAPAMICQGKVFFPSQNGLSILHSGKEYLRLDSYLPAVTDILINQEKVAGFFSDQGKRVSLNGQSVLEFEPSQRSFTFFLSGLNLLDPASQTYSVTLSPGQGSEFVVENDYRARFTNLDPGAYTLEVETGDPGSTQQSILPFRILPYWYERTSVRLGSIALLFLIILAIAYSRIRSLQKDRELARIRADKFELELEVKRVQNDVLRQQMNPHFLNNALNVVLARTRDNKVLYHFVGKVSGLVRDIFNFAWKEQISLKEELIMLERYLHAEKSIHDLELTWSVQMPEGENPANIDVPPMILQPFAENALKHGFIAAGRKKGHISIDMEIEGDQLIISLADNGGGRNPNQASRHFLDPDKPSAIKVVRERLELLNSGIGTEIAKLEIEDLKNEQGSAMGTRVILTLPV